MSIDDRLKDSAPRFRDAVEGFALPDPVLADSRRPSWRGAAAVGFAIVTLVVVAVITLRTSPDPRRRAITPARPDQYAVNATVLERPGSGPELCVGGVLDSLPPQCSGAAIVEWDWTTAPGAQTVRGVTWGEFHVVGTYDDAKFTFTLTQPPTAPLPAQPRTPADKFTAPCPTPRGGWSIVDASKVTLANYQSMTTTVPTQQGYAGMWLDNSTPVDGRVVSLTNQIITFAFTGNLAEHRAQIAAVWGGPICVIQHTRSRTQLDAIVQTVQGPVARELDLRIVGGVAVDDVTGAITVDVMLAPPAAQRQLDQRFGVGVVRLHQVLTPLADTTPATGPVVTTTGPPLPAQTHVAPTKAEIRDVFTTALRCISDAGVVITSSRLTITSNNVQVQLALDSVKSRKSPDDVSAIDSRCRGDLINVSDAWHAAAKRAARS